MDLTSLAVAGMSLIGTLAGTFGGILVSNKLTAYRLEQLVQAGRLTEEEAVELRGEGRG